MNPWIQGVHGGPGGSRGGPGGPRDARGSRGPRGVQGAQGDPEGPRGPQGAGGSGCQMAHGSGASSLPQNTIKSRPQGFAVYLGSRFGCFLTGPWAPMGWWVWGFILTPTPHSVRGDEDLGCLSSRTGKQWQDRPATGPRAQGPHGPGSPWGPHALHWAPWATPLAPMGSYWAPIRPHGSPWAPMGL